MGAGITSRPAFLRIVSKPVRRRAPRKPFFMNAKKPLLSIALVFSALASACGGGDSTSATTATDVAYASVSAAQKLDIYRPSGDGPFPAVLLIHGGGFMFGDKADEAANAQALVARGYVAVSVNYRLSREARFPSQVHDVKAAVRFLRANAATYKIDPERIGSWGASAGGHLSAMLGTSAGVAALEGADLGNAAQSSRVKASVDWFGPINFATMDAQAAALGFTIQTNSPTSPESQYLGQAVADAPALVKQANPSTYISADDAAFFIQHGSADKNIPYTQSAQFHQALTQVKGSAAAQYELIPGAGHGTAEFSTSANLAKVLAFFDANLK